MNNNDGKNYSKTLAIAGMGFLLIATAFTFSFANSGQQLVNAQQNQTQTIVAVPFDTFTGSGAITATIQQQGGGNATAGGGSVTTAAGRGNAAEGGGKKTREGEHGRESIDNEKENNVEAKTSIANNKDT